MALSIKGFDDDTFEEAVEVLLSIQIGEPKGVTGKYTLT